MADLWTTEEVAEYLGITVQQVYESSRRGEFPGNVGKQRGRRKLYSSDLIQAGPQEPETTNDPVEAILWVLMGLERKMTSIAASLEKIADQDPTIVVNVRNIPPPQPPDEGGGSPAPDPEPSEPERING